MNRPRSQKQPLAGKPGLFQMTNGAGPRAGKTSRHNIKTIHKTTSIKLKTSWPKDTFSSLFGDFIYFLKVKFLRN